MFEEQHECSRSATCEREVTPESSAETTALSFLIFDWALHALVAPSGSDYALLLLESAVEGGNVLTKASVDKLWVLNAKVMALEVCTLLKFDWMLEYGPGSVVRHA